MIDYGTFVKTFFVEKLWSICRHVVFFIAPHDVFFLFLAIILDLLSDNYLVYIFK